MALGSPKRRYIYVADGGQTYVLRLARDLSAVAGTGLDPYDPANPPSGLTAKPDRFEPRFVFWQATAPGEAAGTTRTVRKKLVCGSPDSSLYQANTPTTISIDGLAGSTTGKIGERVSF